MRENWNEIDRRVLLTEGGYTNDPQDPGGPTNRGITIRTARRYWKVNATAEDIRTMPLSIAQAIYKVQFWDVICGDQLPSGVDYAVYDYGVHSGPGRPVRVLRAVLGLPSGTKVDGEVLAKLQTVDARRVVDAICDERLRFMRGLKNWEHCKNGWTARVVGVRSYSEHLAAAAKGTLPAHPDLDGARMHRAEGDDAPVDVSPVSGPNDPQEATIDPQSSPVVSSSDPQATHIAPQYDPSPAPSMLGSKSGWAAIGLGGSGALGGLQQMNDYASQLAMAKFNWAELNLSHVVAWFFHNPLALLPIVVIIMAIFVWQDHRKYKRLLHEAKCQLSSSPP